MKNQRRSRQHGRRVWQGVILVLAGFATVAAVTFALQSRGGADDASAPRQISPNGAAANAVPSGPVSVAGLEVGERLADLGRVSLNTPVRREWVLKNRGTTVVTLAQPTIEVLEGC